MPSRRMQRRLASHHLPLALMAAVGLAITYSLVESQNPVFRWSMATAYVGLALLGGTLLTGPLNVLRRRPNPVSTDLRRDIGIWAGLLGVAHFLIGWQVHMPHRYLYWLREVKGSTALRPRADLFGFANYTGLVAVLVAILLLALSNDYFVGRLGSRRWKRLQRWNYAYFALVLLHGVAYQVIEKRKLPYVLALSILVIPSLLIQVLGYGARRAARRESGSSNSELGDAAA